MKKLKNQEQEEIRQCLKVKILPALLEIMANFFGNGKIDINISEQKNGEYITAFAINCDTRESISLHMSIYDGAEKIYKDYNKLAEFIKKQLSL